MSENIDLREFVNQYIRHWKWFVLGVVVAVALAWVYLRYTIPEYAVGAKVEIIDEKSSGGGSQLLELDLLGTGNVKVEDEIEVMKSRSNFVEVVRELGLNTQIKLQGNIIESELYNNRPINLSFIAPDSVVNNATFTFYIEPKTPNSFTYTEEEGGPRKEMSFGANMTTPIGGIVVTPDLEHLDRFIDRTLKISVRPINTVASAYSAKINISPADEYSNIINISLKDPIKEKATDIVNSLIRIYNRNAVEDKKEIADRTEQFINDRIADIATSLTSVDEDAEELKTSRGLTDIASEANINLNVGVANRQELANTQTQLNIASGMKDVVDQQDGYDILPTNVGLNDPTIAATTAQYNRIVQERKRLLKSSTERSPVVQNLNQQLEALKSSISSSLGGTVNSLGMQVNTLSGQQRIIQSRIYSAPGNERALRDITRQQETTESLYLYLLTKREEAQIAVASASPQSQVIDPAFPISDGPVSPRRNLTLLASFLLGLLIPFSVIYLRDLLDNKIHNMYNLEKISRDVPVLGEIPKLGRSEQKFIASEDRSVLAEALRIIRTNVDYLMRSKRGSSHNNVILITSSTSGEGKTFISTNLSLILSSPNKKVLLIGADIRNPKLYTYFLGNKVDKIGKYQRNKDAGLTEYLYDEKLQMKDIVNSMLVHKNTIDVIYSGRIPPNPTELLMSDRMKELVDEASAKYDYVVMDTAPLMVVTDTLLISSLAHHTLYVTRAGVTEKQAVEFPVKLQKEGKISGLAFLVNDVKSANLGYGGKYGYGYTKTQKKWWKL
ncbi:capsular exopolysaccharide family [Robiginitalea myxolifaciens]|uniref:non-specific protein-tyrosine kinase n=1 Tax=Robiginitalea myxolifaciens TaxID=400055 RepID=A0A1I6H1M3_9FLAO|nr:tyrosine-protein kinase family protein [Robiginitalea myxolifaciens]SFR48353.1 capsular exopolysaccharide family [Robiginitalea myxolifaciens]